MCQIWLENWLILNLPKISVVFCKHYRYQLNHETLLFYRLNYHRTYYLGHYHYWIFYVYYLLIQLLLLCNKSDWNVFKILSAICFQIVSEYLYTSNMLFKGNIGISSPYLFISTYFNQYAKKLLAVLISSCKSAFSLVFLKFL